MTVKELIETYFNEELGVRICDFEDQELLIPHIWKTDWQALSPSNEYVYKHLHLYDDSEVCFWEVEMDCLYIYVETKED